jgi:hypothetical protein
LRDEKFNVLKMLLSSVYPPFELRAGEAPIVFAIRDFIKKKMGKANYNFSQLLTT